MGPFCNISSIQKKRSERVLAASACSILARSGPLHRCLRSWQSSLVSHTQPSSILSIAGPAARADFAPCCTAHPLQHNAPNEGCGSHLTDLGSRETCARSMLTSGLLDASAPASSTGCETREGMCRESKDVGAHLCRAGLRHIRRYTAVYPRGKYFSSWTRNRTSLPAMGQISSNMITAPKLDTFLVLQPEVDRTKAQKGLFGFPGEMVKF
ncbi:hypothetical protein C8R45DRAFT_972115 [Mycena sanguinolenta]|nr:hypothetical protein C8R45DRAFT_972115 [Mycena sanguinolenta]